MNRGQGDGFVSGGRGSAIGGGSSSGGDIDIGVDKFLESLA